MSKKTFLMIDGMSFVYRAYYAIRQLTTSSGFPTNAIFGFINMLEKLINDYSPDYMAAAFDTKEPTFRHEKYKDYKSQRKPIPEDLIPQLGPIKDIIRAFNIQLFECPGYEADDILATLAAKTGAGAIKSIIATGDKDMFQIIDGENIFVLSPGGGGKENILYDPERVEQKFGVKPDKIVDMLALAGDSADNISGVPGIGLKTAKALLDEFGSLENILSETDKIKSPARRHAIKEHADKARFYRELVTVNTRAPVDFRIEECMRKTPDLNKLLELFRKFEFTKLAYKYSAKEQISEDAVIINNIKEAEKFFKKLEGSERLYFKTIFDSGEPFGDVNIVGIAAMVDGVKPAFISTEGIGLKELIRLIGPVLRDPEIKKAGYGLKNEIVNFKKLGIDIEGIEFDAEIAAYILNPSRKDYSPESIISLYSNMIILPVERKKEERDLWLKQAASNLCGCVKALPGVCKSLLAEIKEKAVVKLFKEVEMGLLYVLAEMECEGVKIDVKTLTRLSGEFHRGISKIEEEVYNIAGEKFNLNSSKQLGKILFEKLKLPVIKKTKTGYSTDDEVLEVLKNKHLLAGLIKNYRTLSKLISTYVDSMPLLISKKTGRLHTTFNQTVTSTGRLSSSNPNLQNIPIKTEEGRKVREAFVPREGWFLISADYSQIELRILAHLSKDAGLVRAFKQGEDIHTFTAALINGIELENVTEEMRNAAKAVNFGIIYGISSFGLAKNTGVDKKTAGEFIKSYFERYPGVKVFIDGLIKEAREKGYVSTIFNRRRYINEFKSSNAVERNFAQRAAVNTAIQGSAADIIKIAMLKVNEKLKEESFQARMILQVHDELLLEVPPLELNLLEEQIRGIMENVVALDVPLKVKVNSGKSWAEI
ncbi:MAG: DNA polymerase I [Candidatus Aureabacteria bacterium]|nr:DNA polymerase I [Candidatus Auribacterota bacterium]